jgi:hypothetical protein
MTCKAFFVMRQRLFVCDAFGDTFSVAGRTLSLKPFVGCYGKAIPVGTLISDQC